MNPASPFASILSHKAAIDKKVDENENNRQDSLEDCVFWLVSVTFSCLYVEDY